MRDSIRCTVYLGFMLGLLGPGMRVGADEVPPNKHDHPHQEVSERISALRNKLSLAVTNRLITPDQFNSEINKLDQLKIQERVDLKQNDGTLSNEQKEMYQDQLDDIQDEIEEMTTPTTTAPATPATDAPANP
jgi:hypothetical protein